MNAIIEQTKKTIAEKKKEIDENQDNINNTLTYLGENVQKVYRLKNEISMLESDLYSLEKQMEGERSKHKYSDAGCAVGLTPPPNPLYGKDETPIAYKKI